MSASGTLDVAREATTLAPGRRLGDFLITRVVGQGGFGIVYEAEDLTLQRRVAIKEYMPSQLAVRVDGAVSPASSRYAKTFELGRRSFLAEARLLAQFRHPGLLEVLHFWEQDGTAYMVMPFYEGRTLDQVLVNRPDLVDEAWLKAVIRPVLDALEHMHGEDCYHRDVSADNILIRDDGRALLLDLGAARRVIGESDRSLTVMLKPGYAPIEQYADDPACRQGPWTDIYAVAAVLRFAVTNRMPPASAARVMHDSLPALSTLAPPGYSQRFLEAIDRGLSIRPEQRPRTVGEFRSLLFAASPEDGIPSGAPEAGAGTSKAASRSAKAASRSGGASSRARGAAGSLAAHRAPLGRIAAGVAAVLVATITWFALGDGSPSSSGSRAAVADASLRAAPPTSHAEFMVSQRPDRAQGVSAAQRSESAAGVDPASAFAGPSAPVSRTTGAPVNDGAGAPAMPGLSVVGMTPPDPVEAVKPGAGGASVKGAAAGAPSAAASTGARAGTGTVRLAVAPWGEVFVDGVSHGVTPPLKQLMLEAGPHRIEIRNPAGSAWEQPIDVVAGERITLSHRFR